MITLLDPWAQRLSGKFTPVRASRGYRNFFTALLQTHIVKRAQWIEISPETKAERPGRSDRFPTGRYRVVMKANGVGTPLAIVDTEEEGRVLIGVIQSFAFHVATDSVKV